MVLVNLLFLRWELLEKQFVSSCVVLFLSRIDDIGIDNHALPVFVVILAQFWAHRLLLGFAVLLGSWIDGIGVTTWLWSSSSSFMDGSESICPSSASTSARPSRRLSRNLMNSNPYRQRPAQLFGSRKFPRMPRLRVSLPLSLDRNARLHEACGDVDGGEWACHSRGSWTWSFECCQRCTWVGRAICPWNERRCGSFSRARHHAWLVLAVQRAEWSRWLVSWLRPCHDW